VPDDSFKASRGQDGSPSDQGGLGIPSRSAPASLREILIDKFERALRELKADGDGLRSDFARNCALGQVEQAIQRWRAESPSSRPHAFFPLGRPPVLDEDLPLLRALRKAKPGADCRAEFSATLLRRGFGKHWVGARYRAADRAIAKMER
jgi:hypothetical protein